ncbi:hypothetical protein BI024_gp25 [Streptomyces phage Nanodon]|uniref:Uncharacterized protein n=1 Tax=Streptomyces phage Nanodon TaxID=1873777 RepID=A0A1B1PAB2_9CAUD|nr:hypothetical protein BI024_gp25 [Streptomyces phage Nanodon]ANT41095.1 hypothetical protein SEA_NANODON_25 [Streptomyces phage Nanodon]
MGLNIWPPPVMNRPWIFFTPEIRAATDLNTAVASTPSATGCKYKYLDRTTVLAMVDVTVNAAVTSVCCSLPVPAANRQIMSGTAALFGTGTPTDQSGVAYMLTSLNHIVIAAYTQGYRNAASGNVFRYQVIYQVDPA